jgi:RNA polymerase sigma-70 factor (ECF subfamily)
MITVNGVEADFKALFSQEYSGLCRYALTYLQDSHLAEDVVQETFIKIWERKRDMISSPDARFYLITAVRNNCISFLRKIKAEQIHFPEAAPEPEPEPHITTMQHREDLNEQARRISEALDKLPPKCKEVFLMIKMQGLSYKQTADALDISVKTVENQMGKALKVLRESSMLELLLLYGVMLTEFATRSVCPFWKNINLN